MTSNSLLNSTFQRSAFINRAQILNLKTNNLLNNNLNSTDKSNKSDKSDKSDNFVLVSIHIKNGTIDNNKISLKLENLEVIIWNDRKLDNSNNTNNHFRLYNKDALQVIKNIFDVNINEYSILNNNVNIEIITIDKNGEDKDYISTLYNFENDENGNIGLYIKRQNENLLDGEYRSIRIILDNFLFDDINNDILNSIESGYKYEVNFYDTPNSLNDNYDYYILTKNKLENDTDYSSSSNYMFGNYFGNKLVLYGRDSNKPDHYFDLSKTRFRYYTPSTGPYNFVINNNDNLARLYVDRAYTPQFVIGTFNDKFYVHTIFQGIYFKDELNPDPDSQRPQRTLFFISNTKYDSDKLDLTKDLKVSDVIYKSDLCDQEVSIYDKTEKVNKFDNESLTIYSDIITISANSSQRNLFYDISGAYDDRTKQKTRLDVENYNIEINSNINDEGVPALFLDDNVTEIIEITNITNVITI